MKFLVLFFLPILAFAGAAQITASGGSPIPTSYSATNSQSRVLECIGNTIKILNQTDSVLAFGLGRSNAAPDADYSFIPPGPNSGHTVKPQGFSGSGTYLYIRAPNAAETSGTVQVSCTTED